MTRPRPPDCFWLAALALVVIAVVYNVLIADDGETLSEAMDGYIERWPWLSPVIVTVARHLANDFDPHIDPIHLAFVVARLLLPRFRSVALITTTP